MKLYVMWYNISHFISINAYVNLLIFIKNWNNAEKKNSITKLEIIALNFNGVPKALVVISAKEL